MTVIPGSPFHRLSENDQTQAIEDFVIYGRAIVYEHVDGRVELLSPFRVFVTEMEPQPAARKLHDILSLTEKKS